MNHRQAEQFPLVVLGTYAVGYLAGRSIAVLWVRRVNGAALNGAAADAARTRRPAA